MSKNLLALIIIGVILLAGGYLAYRAYRTNQPDSTTTPAAINPPTMAPEATGTATPAAEGSPSGMMKDETMVTITSEGFSPQNITIKAGGTVTWVNNDTATRNVSSAPHPAHTTYPPLNLGNIAPKEKASLTFPKAGTYKYHDHIKASLFGSVIVE